MASLKVASKFLLHFVAILCNHTGIENTNIYRYTHIYVHNIYMYNIYIIIAINAHDYCLCLDEYN